MQMQVESRGNKGEKMSLVIAAISKDNDIIVCGDSRIVDKNGNIVTENENKIYQISDRVVIAYAGSKGNFENLKLYLEIKSLILDINDEESVYEDILEHENNQKHQEAIELLICGFDKDNIPRLFFIYSQIQKYDRELTRVRYFYIGNTNRTIDINIELNTSDIINYMENEISKESKENITVNDVINSIILPCEN